MNLLTSIIQTHIREKNITIIDTIVTVLLGCCFWEGLGKGGGMNNYVGNICYNIRFVSNGLIYSVLFIILSENGSIYCLVWKLRVAIIIL